MNLKRKGAAIGLASLLVAGVAGGGAVVTLNTTLTGNKFWATLPYGETTLVGTRLTVSGDPLVHTFDATRFNDTVVGEWTLSSEGPAKALYDGILTPVGTMSDTLAENLHVQYGTINDDYATVIASDVSWHDAGTLAAPLSYSHAIGAHPDEMKLAGGTSLRIPVRVTLIDPALLVGAEGETLHVYATFNVNYVDMSAAR